MLSVPGAVLRGRLPAVVRNRGDQQDPLREVPAPGCAKMNPRERVFETGNGCNLHSDCLVCPEPTCQYDREGQRHAGGRPSQLLKPRDDLTPVQSTVLELRLSGMTHREIAEWLGINLSTVKSHIAHIRHGRDIRRRDDAAADIL